MKLTGWGEKKAIHMVGILVSLLIFPEDGDPGPGEALFPLLVENFSIRKTPRPENN